MFQNNENHHQSHKIQLIIREPALESHFVQVQRVKIPHSRQRIIKITNQHRGMQLTIKYHDNYSRLI